MSMFKKAERKQLKGRIALDGPSGSGKTYSALRLAYCFGPRIAVIDTEHGSASKYVEERPDGFGWGFDVIELTDFDPRNYVKAIESAGESKYDCIVIDSLSHAWIGKGGALDMVDNSGEKNSYFAWSYVTPVYRSLFSAILASPCHVVATLRTDTAYEVQKDERGRNVPKKIGTKPIIRQGFEYEFDLVGDIDIDHAIKVTKTRCSRMKDAGCDEPGPAFWEPFIQWLALGVAIEPITDAQKAAVAKLTEQLKLTPAQMESGLRANFFVPHLEQLNQQQADQLVDRLTAKLSA